VTINLYQGTSTSGPLVASTTTAADGSYSFGNIGPGTYFVQEVVQSGWTQTGGNAGYTIVATSGVNSTGNNFDNFQKGQITGKKYKDITGNSFSADDTGLGGVTINLYQGTSTSGPLVASTTTAADGSYSFGNLGPGTYFVQEVVQSGWTQTGGNAGYTIVASSGFGCTGNNFDNFQKGQITGKKFKDLTGNSFSADDTGLGGVTIKLYQGTSTSGTLVASTTTAADGSYSFGNLGPGTYFVQEVVQSGWTQTGGNAGYTIVASSGFSCANNNFDNFQNGTIGGAKFLDLTGNGLSADDTGLGGVTIQLYRDANNDGQLTAADGGPVATTVTAAGTGAYSFGNVASGTYIVKEVVGSNYISTAPTSGQYTVVVSACGSTTTDLNFANFDTSACADEATEIVNISYLINGCTTVTDLRGNTNQGDVVQVTFTVAAGTPPHQLTLASYTAPGAVYDPNTASQQQVFDYDTGIFGPGTYTLEVRIPNSFYQIDFVCGSLIDHFGPAGSNIFYSAQGRLLSADNDGTVAVVSNGASLAGMVFVDGNKNNVHDLGEVGVGNAKVTLTGTTSQGQGVTIVGYTKSDGTYLFDNLKAGKYGVAEAQPAGFGDGADILGNLGGTLGSDTFTNITVAASAKGINYDFGEKLTALGSGYSAGFQVDTTDSSKAAIVVNGTSGTDVITVSYSTSTSKYSISLNGTSIATLGNKDASNRPVARLIVNGGNGNDDIMVDSSVTVMTELNGGAGHDRLVGGGGYNILVGGNGNDTLIGSALGNLMIGGNGADVLVGGSAADLIIAGSTSHDSNAAALRAIFAEWTSSRDYTTRINNILGVGTGTRSNGGFFLNSLTVFDDARADRVTAAGGRDWLFAHIGVTAGDILTDLAADETVTKI
jgi:SdrD B-like domain/RTX calcium-binding nonapeptide repeat (4 copies)